MGRLHTDPNAGDHPPAKSANIGGLPSSNASTKSETESEDETRQESHANSAAEYSPAKLVSQPQVTNISIDIDSAYVPLGVIPLPPNPASPAPTSSPAVLQPSSSSAPPPQPPPPFEDSSAPSFDLTMASGTGASSSSLIINPDPPRVSYRQRVLEILRDLTLELRERGALPTFGLADTFNAMQGSPHQSHTQRDDMLIATWEEAMDFLRLYESKLGTMGNHANKLSKRFSEMIKDGGALIEESGPFDHNQRDCSMCNHCKQQLTSIHALIRRQNVELHSWRRRQEAAGPPAISYHATQQPIAIYRPPFRRGGGDAHSGHQHRNSFRPASSLQPSPLLSESEVSATFDRRYARGDRRNPQAAPFVPPRTHQSESSSSSLPPSSTSLVENDFTLHPSSFSTARLPRLLCYCVYILTFSISL